VGAPWGAISVCKYVCKLVTEVYLFNLSPPSEGKATTTTYGSNNDKSDALQRSVLKACYQW